MVAAVAHECSPASSIWRCSSTLRTGRTEHSSSGRSWSGAHMPLLATGGGLATRADVKCPRRQKEEAHAGRPNFSGMSSAEFVPLARPHARHWAMPEKLPPPRGTKGGPMSASGAGARTS